jgi:hypothetical protein
VEQAEQRPQRSCPLSLIFQLGPSHTFYSFHESPPMRQCDKFFAALPHWGTRETRRQKAKRLWEEDSRQGEQARETGLVGKSTVVELEV